MQFLSFPFLAFLATVFLLYWAFPRRRFQNVLLLAASLVFVASWSLQALALLLISALFEWLVGRRMERLTASRARLGLLWVSIGVNLAQLGFFKYAHFFLPQIRTATSLLGWNASSLSILVPVGISFWTLQKMTLTLDVYFGRCPAERNFGRFLLFVSFFPNIVSGPIERARRFLPQLDSARGWDSRRFSEGVWLFAIGALQKIVIADNVADCATALLQPKASGLAVLLGTWAYAIQIYSDFAGYSDMARGVARIFGIDIYQNFQAPYLATNLADFWRRWHASLTDWLNDYIFTPTSFVLRDWGTASILVATWATFLTSGLWHGTGWIFLFWGGIHALGLTIYTLTAKRRKKFNKKWGKMWWAKGLAGLITFHWVCLGYVFFRASSFGEAVEHLQALFLGPWGGLPKWNPAPLIASAIGITVLQSRIRSTGNVFWIFDLGVWTRVILYAVLGFLLLRFYAPAEKFIYFQF